jgi:hypothetical protein
MCWILCIINLLHLRFVQYNYIFLDFGDSNVLFWDFLGYIFLLLDFVHFVRLSVCINLTFHTHTLLFKGTLL